MFVIFGRFSLEEVVFEGEIVFFAHVASHKRLETEEKGLASLYFEFPVDYPK